MTAPTPGPDGYYHPASEDDVRALILLARQQGKTVRVRGSGHSTGAAIYTSYTSPDLYDPITPPRDGNINILMDRMMSVLSWDDANLRVTVQAGCHLGEDPYDPSHASTLENSLFYQLQQRGWAVPDTGGISHQTVGGFLATGSSGSSLHNSVNRQLVALRMIDGNGNVIDLDQSDDRFFAAGVSLGLLGIITQATIQCVPTFNIDGKQTNTTVADCAIDLFGTGANGKPGLEQFFRNTDHTRLMWWPQKGAERMEVWQATVVAPTPDFKPQPYQEFPQVLGSSKPAELGAHAALEAFDKWALPGVEGELTRKALEVGYDKIVDIFASIGEQSFTDYWWHGLPMDNAADDRLISTHFTELWIPIERTADVMVTLRDLFVANGVMATGTYSTEIYPTPSSKFWLSPAYERDVVKVDVFWFGGNQGNPVALYYPQFWDALAKYEFRPHWGKYLPYDAQHPTRWLNYVSAQYPHWNDFMKLRNECDPYQVFVTDYWRAQLGIPRLATITTSG